MPTNSYGRVGAVGPSSYGATAPATSNKIKKLQADLNVFASERAIAQAQGKTYKSNRLYKKIERWNNRISKLQNGLPDPGAGLQDLVEQFGTQLLPGQPTVAPPENPYENGEPATLMDDLPSWATKQNAIIAGAAYVALRFFRIL